MKKYIEERASDILSTTEIMTINSASSTVQELCFLREFLDKSETKFKVTIVASEFFVDRVKLYSEYIFENLDDFSFVAVKVPANELSFKQVEEVKLQKGIEWLSLATKKVTTKQFLPNKMSTRKK